MWLLYVIAIAVGLGILYLLWVRSISYAFKAKDFLFHMSWDKVPAKVLKMSVAQVGTRGPEMARIYPDVSEVEYSYVYKDKEYIGKDIIDQAPKEDIGLIVWVNPKEPDISKICKYKSVSDWTRMENIKHD